jgi:hypothetical protein
MTVVSSKEFATHQKKYFDLAVNEQVVIKRGKNRYRLELETQYPQQPVLEPDDDLRRAITAEELIKRIQKDKRRNYAACI